MTLWRISAPAWGGVLKAWNDGEIIVENIEGLEDLSGPKITLLHRDHPDMPVTLTFQV